MGLSRTLGISAAMIAALLADGCAKRVKVSAASMPKAGASQTGVASWYGDPYHGRRAANGEVYDMNTLTAAHREWPFETMVRVKNLSNNREVEVRITDRGPFVDGRIIDLSRAAAERIQMIGPGITKVRVTVLGPAAGLYAVQAGAFRNRAGAEQYRNKLERSYGRAEIRESEQNGTALYRVWVIPDTSYPDAQRVAQKMNKEGLSAIVVRSRTTN